MDAGAGLVEFLLKLIFSLHSDLIPFADNLVDAAVADRDDFQVGDLTTWSADIAKLTGIQYAGVEAP